MARVISYTRAELEALHVKGEKDYSVLVEARHLDLSGIDLSGVDLSRIDFGKSKLAGADLSGSRLVGCLFHEADLSQAKLTETNLENAYLSGADLLGADLSDAILSHCRATNTRFPKDLCAQTRRVDGLRVNPGTYAKSGWTPVALMELLDSEAEMTSVYDLPAAACEHVLAFKYGLSLILAGELNAEDQRRIRSQIRSVIGGSTTLGFSPSGRHTTVRISSSEVFLPDELDQIFAVIGKSSTHEILKNIELRLRPESLGLSRDILEYLRDLADEHHSSTGLKGSVPRAKRAATAIAAGVDRVLLSGIGQEIGRVAEALGGESEPDDGSDQQDPA